MEVGGAVASALFAAFSLPCLVLLLVLGEAGLRVAALALRGWPTRSALLGYRIARPSASGSYHTSYSPFRDDDEPPLPPECCDRLAVAVYRGAAAAAGDTAEYCAFCLSAVRDGDEVRDLRCRHVFHRACIDAWLVRPRATCPLCRDRLLPADSPTGCCGAEEDDEYFFDDDDMTPSSSSVHAGAASAYAPTAARSGT